MRRPAWYVVYLSTLDQIVVYCFGNCFGNRATVCFPPLPLGTQHSKVVTRPADMSQFAHLLPPSWTSQIHTWLAEDTPSFDYAGYVVGEAEREAFLFGKGKHTAVLAGVPFFTEIFRQLGCQYVIYLSLWFGCHRFLQGGMAHPRRGDIRPCQACRHCEREGAASPSWRESCTQSSRKVQRNRHQVTIGPARIKGLADLCAWQVERDQGSR